jgi:pyruvyltransferase
MLVNLKKRLRKIQFLKHTYRRLRKSIQGFIDFFNLHYYRFKGQKILISHYARVNNFGDLFNKDLVSFFNINLIYTDNYKKSEASLTGSILSLYESDYEGYILGSGFIKASNIRSNTKWKVQILRGPLSAKQCHFRSDCLFGDPGILASLIYDKKVTKKYSLGIIPHDIDLDYVKKLKFGKEVKIINVRRKPSKVAKEIKECDFIASSSLHGLIFADSFLIPNIHLKFGDRLIGGNHKFRDYYLGMDSEHEFIKFDSKMTFEDIISKCKIRFKFTYIENKQYKIIEVYNTVIDKIIRERN